MTIVTTSGCHDSVPIVEMWVPRPAQPALDALAELPRSIDTQQGTKLVELCGAINETLSFSFSIRPDSTPVQNPHLRLAPLRGVEGSIAPSAITLFRMQPVTIDRWPGWHIRSMPPRQRDPHPLDVLVPIRAPRGGLPATMESGQTYHFWADIAIPKGTPAGTYTTAIELLTADASLGSIDVRIEVWPFVLPDDNAVPMIAELDHRALFSHHISYHGRPLRLSIDDWRDDPKRSEMDALLGATLRLLRQHRLTPVLPKLAPIVKTTARDAINIDWGQYDAIVERYMSGQAFFSRVPLEVWPMPLGAVFPREQANPGLLSPTHRKIIRSYAAQCAAHFEEKGWLERSYAQVPHAGIPDVDDAEALRRFAFAAREGSDRIRVLSHLFPQDLRSLGWVDSPRMDSSDSFDIWMPNAQFFDAETMAGLRASGRQTWLAVDRPPYSGTSAVHAPAVHARVLAWQAQQLGAQAIFIGPINEWPQAEQHPDPTDCLRLDPRVLLFPGTPFGLYEPVASVRLKHLRRGMQDVAYGSLLRDHGLEHITEAIGKSLAPYAGSGAYRAHFADGRPIGWEREMSIYDSALETMAGELIRTAYGSHAATNSERLARATAWRRLMAQTRDVDVHVDGTRVRLMGTRTNPTLELECALTVANGTRTPISATVRLTDLPSSWPAPSGRTVESVAPGGSRRVKVTGKAITMPTLPNGVLKLPIELSIDDGTVRRLQARMSYVTAQPARTAIRIDGDLSDWPLGANNVMSDFLLINPDSASESEKAQRAPSHKTVGFVLRDSEYLYIAVNCEADAQLRPATTRAKSVRYDDMIPVSDELVEILIDPLNAGTRSPGDLYHIVVKRSGIDLTEKGIGFDPPCGPREPWAVDLEVATNVQEGRWTTELRIPLDAFDSVGTDHAIWGFNLTRFDAANQEFSTWSGAVRNAYDPLSLGNLCLP